MLILPTDKGFNHPLGSEITPREAYAGRRDMLRLMAGGAAGAALAGWAGRDAWAQTARPNKLAALPGAKSAVAGAVVMDKITDYKDASSYNNFYEFGTDKGDPVKNAHTLKTTPWTVEIEGQPTTTHSSTDTNRKPEATTGNATNNGSSNNNAPKKPPVVEAPKPPSTNANSNAANKNTNAAGKNPNADAAGKNPNATANASKGNNDSIKELIEEKRN